MILLLHRTKENNTASIEKLGGVPENTGLSRHPAGIRKGDANGIQNSAILI